MNKENFTLLLNDLYDKYNQSKKSDVGNLIDQYNGKEFDCIKFFFMKYNFRASSHYDPNVGTDKHVKSLIEQYSKGERGVAFDSDKKSEVDEIVDIARRNTEELSDFAKKQINEHLKEKSEDINQHLKDIDATKDQLARLVTQKLQEINEYVNKKIHEIENVSKKDLSSNVELKYSLNFDEEVELPEEISNLAVGYRILLMSKDGNMIGLEIKDVFLDCVSSPGKIIKEITIEKI